MGVEFEEGDELESFFNLLKRFNSEQDLEIALKIRIEEFFQYKWNFDKNNAIRME